MTNPELELIELLPITTSPPTPIVLALAKHGLRDLKPAEEFKIPRLLLNAIIRDEGLGDVCTAVNNALDSCAAYQRWQKSMPRLASVPQIRAYRTNDHHMDPFAVNQEVLIHGGYLQAGQILYRGGTFTSASIVISDGPVSTSMHPKVAWWHACKHSGQIAILRIAGARSVKGFVYRTTGNQNLKQEYEVLLQNHLWLEQSSIYCVNNLQVMSYEVYPQNAKHPDA